MNPEKERALAVAFGIVLFCTGKGDVSKTHESP
jgi:hypothetical protein